MKSAKIIRKYYLESEDSLSHSQTFWKVLIWLAQLCWLDLLRISPRISFHLLDPQLKIFGIFDENWKYLPDFFSLGLSIENIWDIWWKRKWTWLQSMLPAKSAPWLGRIHQLWHFYQLISRFCFCIFTTTKFKFMRSRFHLSDIKIINLTWIQFGMTFFNWGVSELKFVGSSVIEAVEW